MKIREAQIFSDEVVDILTQIRIDKGVSRYRIAQKCEITEAALSYIERHERRPTIYTLKIIADFLNVKLHDIFKQAEDNSKA